MNFNIYLSKKLGDKITHLAKELDRSRNSIITEALELWIDDYKPKTWPKGFFDFKPVKNTPDFKATRKELKKVKDDPFA